MDRLDQDRHTPDKCDCSLRTCAPVGWDREKEVRSAGLRIGAAAAFGRYEIAIVLSVINFATLRLLTPLKQGVK